MDVMKLKIAFCDFVNMSKEVKGKGKVHPCTGTEALYRPYSR